MAESGTYDRKSTDDDIIRTTARLRNRAAWKSIEAERKERRTRIKEQGHLYGACPQRANPLRGGEEKRPFQCRLRESYYNDLRRFAREAGLSQPQFIEMLVDYWRSKVEV